MNYYSQFIFSWGRKKGQKMGPIVHYQLVVLHWMIFNYQGTEKRTCQIFQTQKIPKRKISNCHIWKVKLVSMRRVIDCLQSAFSLKICLVLDLIQHDWVPRCYYIGIEMRWEKTDCWLFCSKQTLRQPRNRVTDWSIAQLVRLQAIKIVTHHKQLQTIAKQAVISVIKLLRISYRRKLL